MSKAQKRRNRPGGGGFGKAQSWMGRDQIATDCGSNQVSGVSPVLPLTLAGLLSGRKRYRAGLLLDDDGNALPTVLVVDNLKRTIATLTMDQAEQWALGFQTEPASTLISGWVATWRAEQAGLRGCA